ncbi:MAG: PilZ domain-containing protein [Rhodocyclaceae bacterium]|nr:PilZ domain-containing protein [Rhodocyclaceae bacterium]
MDTHDEKRLSRRIPLGCDALIQPIGGQERFTAKCLEIGAGGMTLESKYVPGLAEQLDVLVRQPDGGADNPPLHVRVEVKRSHKTASGDYQLGARIVQVLK